MRGSFLKGSPCTRTKFSAWRPAPSKALVQGESMRPSFIFCRRDKEYMNKLSEKGLLKDNQWSTIDGELCRVIDFVPRCAIKDGKVLVRNKWRPYAIVTIECKRLSEKTTGFIYHKVDFINLWLAFKERGLREDEEALIIWSKKHYKKLHKMFAVFLPKLWVMICPKGSFELETNLSHRPELTGEARWSATRPIIEWKPEVMM